MHIIMATAIRAIPTLYGEMAKSSAFRVFCLT